MSSLKIYWTVHALERLPERGLGRTKVEQALREAHAVREPNKGQADWRVDAGRFVVLYDHPAGDDIDAVRIITVWPKRRKPRRHLRLIHDETESYPDR